MTDSETRAAADTGRHTALWIARLLALLAGAVAGYLAITSRYGLPLGCGTGSGCSEVLQSRWAALFGVPVGYFALAAHLTFFAATFAATAAAPPLRAAGRFLLITCAGAIVGAAIWFGLLQAVALQAVCVWCMLDHALGSTAAIAACVWAWQNALAESIAGRTPSRVAPALGTGLALAILLVLLQLGFSRSGSSLVRLPAGQNADSGPGTDRQIAVLGGDLTLTVRELPVLGSPDAEHLLVLLYDYACPHCRATHGYLTDGLDQYAGQYAVVLLPMPLDAKCNPTVEETEPRFEDSCELARLALAVWRASPDKFAQFDAWLYETESPRSAGEARAYAESLVDQSALDAALNDEWVTRRIDADVAAYQASGADQIPVLVSPGIDTVVGRPESADDLFALLEKELRLQPATP